MGENSSVSKTVYVCLIGFYNIIVCVRGRSSHLHVLGAVIYQYSAI